MFERYRSYYHGNVRGRNPQLCIQMPPRSDIRMLQWSMLSGVELLNPAFDDVDLFADNLPVSCRIYGRVLHDDVAAVHAAGYDGDRRLRGRKQLAPRARSRGDGGVPPRVELAVDPRYPRRVLGPTPGPGVHVLFGQPSRDAMGVAVLGREVQRALPFPVGVVDQTGHDGRRASRGSVLPELEPANW